MYAIGIWGGIGPTHITLIPISVMNSRPCLHRPHVLIISIGFICISRSYSPWCSFSFGWVEKPVLFVHVDVVCSTFILIIEALPPRVFIHAGSICAIPDVPTILELTDSLRAFSVVSWVFCIKLFETGCYVVKLGCLDNAVVECAEDRKSTRLNSSHITIS